MSVDYRQLGSHIKQVRKTRHMTQEGLAERLNVSVGYVSQFERGVTKISLDLLSSVAAILQCEIASLLDGVSVGRDDYLASALQKQFSVLSSSQRQLLLEIAQLLSKSDP